MLVPKRGSIDWLCLPRFDSPSVFAAILDDDAGHLSIRPADVFTVSRRYVERTMGAADEIRDADGRGRAH